MCACRQDSVLVCSEEACLNDRVTFWHARRLSLQESKHWQIMCIARVLSLEYTQMLGECIMWWITLYFQEFACCTHYQGSLNVYFEIYAGQVSSHFSTFASV